MNDDFSSSIYWNDLNALNKPDHDFYTAVLSTINDDKPASRIVVVRTIELELKRVLFYTDYRSGKISQLRVNPNCQLLFYNNASRYQLILSCIATVEHNSDLSVAHWDKIRRKDAYHTVDAPGSLIEGLRSEAIIDPELAEGGKGNFAVIVCDIKQVDVFQIAQPNQRYKYVLNEDCWETFNLVP